MCLYVYRGNKKELRGKRVIPDKVFIANDVLKEMTLELGFTIYDTGESDYINMCETVQGRKEVKRRIAEKVAEAKQILGID